MLEMENLGDNKLQDNESKQIFAEESTQIGRIRRTNRNH